MTTAITKTKAEDKEMLMLHWTPEQVETIRNTVAKGATNHEMEMFLHLSQTYGLDPFAKEIWFVKMGGTPTIMASRDGYLKIANRNPHFQGMDADVVYEGDIFEKTQGGGVKHHYGTRDRGQPIGAYCRVFRDDRPYPTYVYAPFKDYRKGGLWNTYPHAMILKVAEAQALKRAFSISGLVTREELEVEMDTPTRSSEAISPMQRSGHVETSEAKKDAWKAFLALFNGDAERAKAEMLKVTDGRGSADWTEKDLEALRNAWTDMRAEVVDVEIEEGPETKPADKPTSDSGDRKREMSREIEALLGETGLGLTQAEQTDFIAKVTNKGELQDLTMAEMGRVVFEAKKAIEARFGTED